MTGTRWQVVTALAIGTGPVWLGRGKIMWLVIVVGAVVAGVDGGSDFDDWGGLGFLLFEADVRGFGI